jgi:hypothetical protein
VPVYIRAGDTTQPFVLHGTNWNLNLDRYVTAPNICPATIAIDNEQYTGTGAWQKDVRSGGKVVYTAIVTLRAKSGWTFDDLTTRSFSHSGATSVSFDMNTMKVTLVFPPTENSCAEGFSNLVSDGNSALDLIGAASKGKGTSVLIGLKAGTEPEQVDLSDTSSDIGVWNDKKGLTLTTSNSPANVTIDGGGRVVDLTGSAQGSLITVGEGVTLTLKNITFKGLRSSGDSDSANDSANNTASLIKVVAGGTLILGYRAVIRDNTTTSNGGGVYLEGSGHLTMNTGSEISHNQAGTYGGGVYGETGGASTFNMTGGTISNNAATQAGGGVAIYTGTFTMTGGAISTNSATAGGGVGIANNGNFTMNSGEIKGNTATEVGGGVYIQSSTFALTGNGVITKNISNHTSRGGGGVAIWESTFTMTGGTISRNQATGTNGKGGGVWTNDSGNKFGKSGGIIYGSTTADGSDDEDTNLANTANTGSTAAIRLGLDSKLAERQKTSDASNVLYYNYDGFANSGWD